MRWTCGCSRASSQTGAVVGLLALVVIFQPELRRGLERIGRVGSLGWVFAPSGAAGLAEGMARTLARTAAALSANRTGALIVIERETGLEDTAETGVMLHADLSEELLASIFARRTALHDGAVIVRAGRILAAGAVLPLSETSRPSRAHRHPPSRGHGGHGADRCGGHRGQRGDRVDRLVQRGRMLRDLDEERLRTALVALLRPDRWRRTGSCRHLCAGRAVRARQATPGTRAGVATPRRSRVGRPDHRAACARHRPAGAVRRAPAVRSRSRTRRASGRDRSAGWGE